MRVDPASWLPLLARSSVATVTATVTVTEPGGTAREVSVHDLHAESLLQWSYTVRIEGRETSRTCDGREMSDSTGRRPVKSEVPPTTASMDEPWYFYSWPGAVDGWLVEMLRPVDLLARVVITSLDRTSRGTELRIEAEPMGSESSPYSGFSLPDGRSLLLSLDIEQGCFTDVTVIHPGVSGPVHRLTYQLTRIEP